MARVKIQNLDELSDGGEILENKPNKFISYFIYILIAMFLIFLLWGWFSKKEVVITANGLVEPTYQIYNVSPLLSGAVKSINYKNGDYVKKGDVILTLNVNNAKNQLNSLENQQILLSTSIKSLKSLQSAVYNGDNFIGDENKYYDEFNSYLAQNNIANSEVTLSKSQAGILKTQINSLQNLERAIENDSNYNSENSLYNNEFKSYEESTKSLENKIQSLKKEYSNIKNEKDIRNNYNNITKAGQKSQVYTNKIKKFNQDQKLSISRNNKVINAQNDLAQSQQQLQNENTNDNFDNELNSITTSILQEQGQLNSLKSKYLVQIEQELQNLDGQLDTTNGATNKTYLSKILNKWKFLSQINTTLNSENIKLNNLNDKIKVLKNEINNGEVKVSSNGILYMPQTPQVGMVIKAGEEIAEVIPNDNNFKVKIIIPNSEIGNIKVGDTVKYSFLSFPYTEYGFLNGSLKSISITSEINPKTGLSYYVAIGTLNSDLIKNRNGKQGKIRLGMTCESKIVSRQEKMLYYILNQLGL